MFEPGSRSDTMFSPGAATSMVRAVEVSVNADSAVPGVEDVVPGALDPTESTNGSYPGLVSAEVPPPLPPATTTTMPWFQAFSTANVSGSDQAGALPGVPEERFSTRIGLAGSSLRCCTTQST